MYACQEGIIKIEKSSGAAFMGKLVETLDTMGYKKSYADPDVRIRP